MLIRKYFKLTCNFLPGSLEAVGSTCAGEDNVEVLVARSEHGGNVGATVGPHESGTVIFTIIYLHTSSTAVSDLRIYREMSIIIVDS